MKDKFSQLRQLGQSLWLDYIRRSFITSGELRELVEDGLGGVTSNPSIFQKAIAGSTDYDDQLHRLVEDGFSEIEMYERLAVRDIQMAADELRPVYDATEGADGYVSLEVRPDLAHDTTGTLSEARRLYQAVGRPNAMIKVPATPEGIPAIRALIGEGININITLIFSRDQYHAVVEAFLAGLETLAGQTGDLANIASVASFFVSRLDSKTDRLLAAAAELHPEAANLKGRIAIANAKMAYADFQALFSGERWQRLEKLGARPQRVLWASTSTKDPSYPDTLYVDQLIGTDIVNTVPPATLRAYLDHGSVAETVTFGLDQAAASLAALPEFGVDLGQVTDELLSEGVAGFARSFEALIESIRKKRDKLRSGWLHLDPQLGSFAKEVEEAISDIAENKIVRRIWAHDHTVWKPDPEEITNRLGWLHSPAFVSAHLARLNDFRAEVRRDGYSQILLLGMGGSSLAPEVFQKTFGPGEDGLRLSVLDSTDPEIIRCYRQELDLARTLFVVATKSGGTVETLSFFKYFYNEVVAEVGEQDAGAHFVAITDPGSKLEDLAQRYRFRATFLNDAEIGGRYSALSFFGLVPAALIGLDVERLLENALAMASGCESCVESTDNPAVLLGAAMGALARAGRDKMTFLISRSLASFGDWAEQLIAESTGKDGRGILPVVGETPGPANVYGADRFFIDLRLGDDTENEPIIEALAEAGHPVIRIQLHEKYDLGGQFFLWELATAIAGYCLEIQPFDQPNVEAAKNLAREMVEAYQEKGELPVSPPSFHQNGITVTGDVESRSLNQAIEEFLSPSAEGRPGGNYVAIQAYLTPDPMVEETLHKFRMKIRDDHRLATTFGYGPRFLHSTGQLHKGDAGNGLFIQITQRNEHDIPIPDEAGKPDSSISFGVLITAQALGDRQALLDAGRRVLRLGLGPGPIRTDLERLTRAVQ